MDNEGYVVVDLIRGENSEPDEWGEWTTFKYLDDAKEFISQYEEDNKGSAPYEIADLYVTTRNEWGKYLSGEQDEILIITK